uniref:Capsid protein n=1 Tax=Mops bat astrovirus TaxID=3141890 RepID=A0AAU7E167_9VIRU
MADSKPKAEVKKAVKQATKEAVKEVLKPKPQRQRKKRDWKKEKKAIKNEVKKELKKENGPRSQYKVKVTASLGHVSGEDTAGPTLKLSAFLHPSLCKGSDEREAFGPLQAAAAQYGLWRCVRATVKFTPLVGASAVSGSIVRTSLNLTQTPSTVSWGGLGARKHRDITAGRNGSFILSRGDLAGPRDGGWWLTDTNNEGAQACGPIVEAHIFGQTFSTYQDKPWTSHLFIVELTGVWEFANYCMNPGLGSLERADEKATVTLKTAADGAIEMEVSDAPAIMRLLQDPTVRDAEAGTTGETIWQIVDSTANAISSVSPPPFGWLIKGGWWFVKKLAGRARAGTERLQVYASLADAQNGRPAMSTLLNENGKPVTTELQVTQVNQPNLGASNGSGAVLASSGPITPMDPKMLGDQFNFSGYVKRITRYESKAWPLMFLENLLVNGTHNYHAAVLQTEPLVLTSTTGRGSQEVLDCFTNRLPWPLDYSGFKIASRYIHAAKDVQLRVAAYYSEQVNSSVWLNAIFVSSDIEGKSFSNVVNTKVWCFDYLVSTSETENWSYTAHVYSSKNISFDIPSFEGAHVILFASSAQLRPGSIPPPAVLSGGTLAVPCSWIKGLLWPGGVEASTFGGKLHRWSPQPTARERLAQRLGMSLEELEDALDQSDTDEDDDGDSFEQVSEPASGEYLSLRESGLTHAEALEVLSCRK